MRSRRFPIAAIVPIAVLHATLVQVAMAKPSPRAPSPAASSSLAGLELYSSDGGHSVVQFSVPWMGLSNVRGSFSEIRATIAYDTTDVTRSSITVVIGAATLYTANEHRDKDLKSAD